MFSISGIASGLDTENMVRQLLQVERLPLTRLEQQQAALRKVDDAWGQVTTRLSSLRSAIDRVTSGTAFAARWKASSSNDATATASVSGTPAPGSTTFTVDQLAAVQTSHSAGVGAFATADSLVGSGTFRLLRPDGSELGSVTTDGTTTLAQLATQVDAITGVRAQVVKKADGDHRLVLTGEATGTEHGFTVSTDHASFVDGFTTTAAKDALLTVGGLQVARSTNTVTDLVAGVTVTLKATGSATVTTSQDVDSAVASVRKLVDEVNATLARLKELSRYDAEAKKGGPLQGDATSRRMVDRLRRGVMDVVSGIAGSYTTAGSVGISMNDDGGFTVDDTKLRAALTEDAAAVDRLFSRSGSVSLAGVSYTSSTSGTEAGTYDLVISQVAEVARLTGATYTAPATNPETFTITAKDGTVVEVTVAVGDSAAVAVDKINTALATANVDQLSATTVTLPDGSTALELAESRYGAAYGFSVGPNTLGLAEGTYAGRDVAGTIDGQAATGSGQQLSLPSSSTSGAAGLVLTVGSSAPLNTAGTVTVATGVAGRLDQLLATYEGSTGAVQGARNSLQGRIDLYQDRIDAFELRLASRETTIRRQFTAMETALAQLQSQGNWLAGQLGAWQRPQE